MPSPPSILFVQYSLRSALSSLRVLYTQHPLRPACTLPTVIFAHCSFLPRVLFVQYSLRPASSSLRVLSAQRPLSSSTILAPCSAVNACCPRPLSSLCVHARCLHLPSAPAAVNHARCPCLPFTPIAVNTRSTVHTRCLCLMLSTPDAVNS